MIKTDVIPSAAAPTTGDCITVMFANAEQLSVPVTNPDKSGTVYSQLELIVKVWFTGHVATGSILSTRFTETWQSSEFPCSSVTVIVTWVFVEIVVPDPGDCVTTKFPTAEQLSEAVIKDV